MSDHIDPDLLARSRKKFGGDFGAKAEKKEEEPATKAAPRRVTVEALADDKDVLERAKKLREEVKRGER